MVKIAWGINYTVVLICNRDDRSNQNLHFQGTSRRLLLEMVTIHYTYRGVAVDGEKGEGANVMVGHENEGQTFKVDRKVGSKL